MSLPRITPAIVVLASLFVLRCPVAFADLPSVPYPIGCLAKPSNTSHYSGGHVGGGAAILGQPRYPDEGTWGWDYPGILHRRIWLNWWHGKHQAGGGSYKTDGPTLHLIR